MTIFNYRTPTVSHDSFKYLDARCKISGSLSAWHCYVAIERMDENGSYVDLIT